jgi:hypothetical protein
LEDFNMYEDRGTPEGLPANREEIAQEEEVELTAAERRALAALPRELDASNLHEERVVRSLRQAGVLSTHPPRRGRSFWMAASAAGIVLCLSGTVLGQWLGGRAAADAVVAAGEAEAAALQFVLQEMGSAYVAQLGRLADMRVGESGDPVLLAQGREVGFATLFAATNELARLDPTSAELEYILELLRPLVQPRPSTDSEPAKVFWF